MTTTPLNDLAEPAISQIERAGIDPTLLAAINEDLLGAPPEQWDVERAQYLINLAYAMQPYMPGIPPLDDNIRPLEHTSGTCSLRLLMLKETLPADGGLWKDLLHEDQIARVHASPNGQAYALVSHTKVMAMLDRLLTPGTLRPEDCARLQDELVEPMARLIQHLDPGSSSEKPIESVIRYAGALVERIREEVRQEAEQCRP